MGEPESTLTTGTWFVVRTSLPFWRRRTDPAITYTELPDGTVADIVTYRSSRGRGRRVVGIDTPLGDGRYRWRGVEPATVLTSSEWSVVAHRDSWAVTHFAKTLFTPEGMDVYWRRPHPDEDAVREVVDGIRHHALAGPFSDRLFSPTHHP